MKKPLKILVAVGSWNSREIEEAIRDFGNDVRSPGYNVSTAYDGAVPFYDEAMEMIKKERFDVVVVWGSMLRFTRVDGGECVMLGLTCGCGELIKFIRCRSPKTKIILLSYQKTKLLKKTARNFGVEADVSIQIEGPLTDYFHAQKEGMGWLIFKKALENIRTKVSL